MLTSEKYGALYISSKQIVSMSTNSKLYALTWGDSAFTWSLHVWSPHYSVGLPQSGA